MVAFTSTWGTKMLHDAVPFLLLAQTYILHGKNKLAWRAAIMAARIASARHDEAMQVKCDYVLETVEQL
jgi:hypothetical protein